MTASRLATEVAARRLPLKRRRARLASLQRQSFGRAAALAAGLWCFLALARPLLAQCPDGTPPPCGPRGAGPPPNSVAVLYFENQSRDTADAYLAQGLTKAIIAKLGDIPRLTVKSRYVVRRYSGAESRTDPATLGRTLGVSYIVTGGVQRAGNRLRVTAELARATTGNRVWGQQYERGDGDVFAIQEDIARGVATGIAGRLLPAEAASLAARPTRNNEAYEHLLRGDVLLGRALALDSSNSDAWMARGYLMTFRNPRNWEGAEGAMRRAVALNPRNAEAWHQLADLLIGIARGHPRADSILPIVVRAYRQALAREPSRPITLRALGWLLPPSERVIIWDSALVLDPTYYGMVNRTELQRLRGDTAGARAALVDAERIVPDGARLYARGLRALQVLALGDTADARWRLEALLQDLGSSGPIAVYAGYPPFMGLTQLGDWARATDVLDRMPRGVYTWYNAQLANLPAERLAADPRLRRIVEENRPPWVPRD